MNSDDAKKLTATARKTWWKSDHAKDIVDEVAACIHAACDVGRDRTHTLLGTRDIMSWQRDMVIKHLEAQGFGVKLGFDVVISWGD